MIPYSTSTWKAKFYLLTLLHWLQALKQNGKQNWVGVNYNPCISQFDKQVRIFQVKPLVDWLKALKLPEVELT